MVTSPPPSGRQVLEIDDAVRIRALSHPARLAIIEYLENGQTATATELAAIVGLSPSATSYHLRELARGGLIRETEGRGDGRERVWQSVADGLHYDSDNLGDDKRDDAYGLLGALMAWQDTQAQRFYAAMPGLPQEWQDASNFYGARIVVTPDELRELAAQIRTLIERYSRSNRTEIPEDARVVSMIVRGMPRLAPDESSQEERLAKGDMKA
jgi:DNA-binding transcriptional ArsR family regulator